MVLLSFSVKEDELRAGTKIRTTRLYTPEKYALWQRTLPGGDLSLDGWWKLPLGDVVFQSIAFPPVVD